MLSEISSVSGWWGVHRPDTLLWVACERCWLVFYRVRCPGWALWFCRLYVSLRGFCVWVCWCALVGDKSHAPIPPGTRVARRLSAHPPGTRSYAPGSRISGTPRSALRRPCTPQRHSGVRPCPRMRQVVRTLRSPPVVDSPPSPAPFRRREKANDQFGWCSTIATTCSSIQVVIPRKGYANPTNRGPLLSRTANQLIRQLPARQRAGLRIVTRSWMLRSCWSN